MLTVTTYIFRIPSEIKKTKSYMDYIFWIFYEILKMYEVTVSILV